MKPEERQKIESRIRRVRQELGLLEPSEGTPAKRDLEEIEELYADLERLMQELERDC